PPVRLLRRPGGRVPQKKSGDHRVHREEGGDEEEGGLVAERVAEAQRGERRDRGTAHAGPEHPDRRAPTVRGEPRVDRGHTDGEGGTADPEEETADEQGRQAAVDEPHEQGGGDRQRCHEREHGAAAEPVGERAHRDTAERAHHDRQGHHERLLERGQSESLLVGGAQRPHERPRPEGEQEPAEAQREREGGLPGSGFGRHVRAPFTSDTLSEHATQTPGLSSSWRTGLDSGTGRQTSQSLGENSSAWIRDPSTPASRKPDRTARRKPEEPQRNTCASSGTATSDRSMSPAWTAPGPVTASAP